MKLQEGEETKVRELFKRVGLTLDMIKFPHTIFALPFALLSMIVAAGGWPIGREFFWIVAACVFARSAAMAFNRLHDEPFDRQNPRTKNWALPSGKLSHRFVLVFLFICVGGFVLSAAMLNTLALLLSPVALAILLGYSVTKRFTAASHFFLGLALAIAPVGAWIAIRGSFALAPVVLALGVLLWTSGFDIIYSCQDAEIDRKLGLFSLPSRWGLRRALAISAMCHVLALGSFLAFWWLVPLGGWFLFALAACGWLLAYEQEIISPDDLSRVGQAFFTLNGVVSIVIFLGGLLDILLAG